MNLFIIQVDIVSFQLNFNDKKFQYTETHILIALH